jgi:hypothetical protein
MQTSTPTVDVDVASRPTVDVDITFNPTVDVDITFKLTVDQVCLSGNVLKSRGPKSV